MIAPGAEDFAAPFPNNVKANKIPKPGPGFASNKLLLLVQYLAESKFRG